MFAVLLATTLHMYAATPERAALQVVHGSKKPLVVQRTNVAGSYAAVLIRGGLMEGSEVTAPILLQHFSFGWQALDLLNFHCRLESHKLGHEREVLLMRGMPNPDDDRPCRGEHNDAGPPTDVEAVRRLMQGPLVPYVVVSHNWAMGEWYGFGGGQTLYQRRGGRWHRVTGGGGTMSLAEVRAYGVPYDDACRFDVIGAPCH